MVALVIGVLAFPVFEDCASEDFARGATGRGGFLVPCLLAPGGGPLTVVGAGGGGLGAPRLPKKVICGLPMMAMTVGVGTAHAGGAISPFDLGWAPGGIGWAHSPPTVSCGKSPMLDEAAASKDWATLSTSGCWSAGGGGWSGGGGPGGLPWGAASGGSGTAAGGCPCAGT